MSIHEWCCDKIRFKRTRYGIQFRTGPIAKRLARLFRCNFPTTSQFIRDSVNLGAGDALVVFRASGHCEYYYQPTSGQLANVDGPTRQQQALYEIMVNNSSVPPAAS